MLDVLNFTINHLFSLFKYYNNQFLNSFIHNYVLYKYCFHYELFILRDVKFTQFFNSKSNNFFIMNYSFQEMWNSYKFLIVIINSFVDVGVDIRDLSIVKDEVKFKFMWSNQNDISLFRSYFTNL